MPKNFNFDIDFDDFSASQLACLFHSNWRKCSV